MSIKKYLKFFILLLLIACLVDVSLASGDGLVLSDTDLHHLSRNGLISSMCYVQDLLTGKVSRAVAAVFVCGTGFTFLVSGKIAFKTVVLFTVAIALIYGGFSFADAISGNKYSCKSLTDVSNIETGVIVNAGDCVISQIDGYAAGQTWKECDYDNLLQCDNKVGSTTEITEQEIVSLVVCQEGFHKIDDQTVSKYVCSKTTLNGTDVYSFTRYSGVSPENLCKMYCDKNSIVNLFNNNTSIVAKTSLGGDIGSLTIANIEHIGILSNTGSHSPYGITFGTELKVGCAPNTTIYNADGTIIPRIYDENGNEITDTSNIKVKCNENGIPELVGGSCGASCVLNYIGANNYTKKWKKCDNVIDANGFTHCQTIDTTTAGTQPIYVESNKVIQTDECKTNNVVPHSNKRSVFKCDNGNWSLYGTITIGASSPFTEMSNEENSGEKNTSCEAGCSLAALASGEHIENFKERRKESVSGTFVQPAIPSGTPSDIIYYDYDLVTIDTSINAGDVVTGCASGYKVKTKNRCSVQSAAANTLVTQWQCQKNGVWKNIYSDREKCEPYCLLTEVTGATGAIGAASDFSNGVYPQNNSIWGLFTYDNDANTYSECSHYTTGTAEEKKYIHYDEYLKATECLTGYSLPQVSQLPYFKCLKEGSSTAKLKLVVTNNNNSCKKDCKIKDDNSVVEPMWNAINSWKRYDVNNNYLETLEATAVDANKAIKYKETLQMDTCNSLGGYTFNRTDTEATKNKYVCDDTVVNAESITAIIFNSGNAICKEKCNVAATTSSILESDRTSVLNWKKCTADGVCSENNIDITVSGGVDLKYGEILEIKTCKDDFKLNNTASDSIKRSYKCGNNTADNATPISSAVVLNVQGNTWCIRK